MGVESRFGSHRDRLRDAERHNTFSARQAAAKVIKPVIIIIVIIIVIVIIIIIIYLPRNSNAST